MMLKRIFFGFPCGILPKKRIFWEDLGRTPEELRKKAPKIQDKKG
ncbi:hypothetical protein BPO_1328 [Bergeyella porcorum]|uniref:Uncharacterized protein n=1 Tax=Bergeyella porcorum TaxID=1735111 RepID=A0AAU0F1L3_9FLAO